MIRLFIALEIPDIVKDLVYTRLQESAEYTSDFKWEPKEKFHLTLKFIGDIRKELLPDIVREIEFVKDFSTFNSTISKFGFFFRKGQPVILWCNFDTGDQINSLVSELNLRLEKFGIEKDKRNFKGHLTLLRIKNRVSENFIKSFKELKYEPIQFNSNKIALIESDLNPTGSEYKVLKIYELK